MKDYIKLLRVKHYIKNVLVFLPMFFARELFNAEKLIQCALGFVCFCLTSSAVYILNDIQDVEKDRKHPQKKNRPIASGRVKVITAYSLLALCLLTVATISVILKNWAAFAFLAVYFVLNVAYSMGLKNKPIIDIVILAAGFVIRIFYGGFLSGIEISKWLYLVVVTGSLYMGLGKRRNELKQHTETREVLKYYTEGFLDKNMYVCVSLVIVFYALWTIESVNAMTGWTLPLFIVILMKYSLNVEGESDGDPVEVILHDKFLIGITLCYAISIFALLYFM